MLKMAKSTSKITNTIANSRDKSANRRNTNVVPYDVVTLATSAFYMSFVYFLKFKGHSLDLVVKGSGEHLSTEIPLQ